MLHPPSERVKGWMAKQHISLGGVPRRMSCRINFRRTVPAHAFMSECHAPVPCMAQRPLIFEASTVVVGAQRLETDRVYAAGKWSDAGPKAFIASTEIHCYKRFGFCEVANASNPLGDASASVSLTSYDILRWDANEMIAVDSSAICLVNTLRFDFSAKTVSMSSALKSETNNKLCQTITPSMTATVFLVRANGGVEQKAK